MKGVIVNFRRGRTTYKGNHMIVLADGIDSREKAHGLVGKKATYDTGKKKIEGKVASAHGNKGALRVIFETGMPGQSVSKEVLIE